jgi:8-oxo-dGTP pyrophosphatase MutT (NUDIX family)
MAERVGTWIAIYCPRKQALLMARRSQYVNNPYLWNFFGGQADPGETPAAAALRELREEAGIQAARKYLMEVAHIRLAGLGYTGIERDLYLFLLMTDDLIRVRLDIEHSEYRWFRRDNLPLSVNRVTQIILDKGLLEQAMRYAGKHPGKTIAA